MKIPLKNSLFITVALLSGLVGFYAFQTTQNSVAASDVPTNTTFDFALPDLQGNLRQRQEWSDKILVLNFWATWCGPCKEEIPTFIQLQKTFAQHNVQFVGIATLDKKADVIAFAQAVGINYPILIGDNDASALSMRLGNLYGILPFTVITDASGHIQERIAGALDHERALELLNALIPKT